MKLISPTPGPVGLAAGLASSLYSPRSIIFLDLSDTRLALAQRMLPGPNTHTINTSSTGIGSDISAIRAAASAYFDPETDGFDVVMEAVGIPATFDMCQALVGKGGTIANIGVHSAPVELKIDRLWPRGTSKSMSYFRPGNLVDRRNCADSLFLLFVRSALNGPSQHAHDPSHPRFVIGGQAGHSGDDGHSR
jgi:threonine dehydrogenase-like Zn-dependent dehydrogenase